MFSDFLFCGFSCSDAIMYLFTEDILRKIECVLKDNKNNIKDISLSIECYDNILAKRYYMYTDIDGYRNFMVDLYFTNYELLTGYCMRYMIEQCILTEMNNCFNRDIYKQ